MVISRTNPEKRHCSVNHPLSEVQSLHLGWGRVAVWISCLTAGAQGKKGRAGPLFKSYRRFQDSINQCWDPSQDAAWLHRTKDPEADPMMTPPQAACVVFILIGREWALSLNTRVTRKRSGNQGMREMEWTTHFSHKSEIWILKERSCKKGVKGLGHQWCHF